MAQASSSIDIPASPDEVWQLIGGFNSLPDWLPYILKSELSEGGRVRHLVTPTGDTIIERLERFDNTARTYSYSILKAPFKITNYLATIRVEAKDGGSPRLEWSGIFTPNGMSDEEASKLFQGTFDDGLKALAAR
jgi:Polyketide cyclase / dehydrase and lipid transport